MELAGIYKVKTFDKHEIPFYPCCTVDEIKLVVCLFYVYEFW